MSQLRCLVCGSSQLDPEGYKCDRCGSAIGLRGEECHVSEETKRKLIRHAAELSKFGIKVEQIQGLRKTGDVGTAVGIIGVVISLAESLHPGWLRDSICYLRDRLHLPDKEILSLRLGEPDEVLTFFRKDTCEDTTAFDAVLPLVERWRPKLLPGELSYRNSLLGHLRKNLCKARIEPEYRHLGTTVDIYVKQPSNSEVFLELKRNLHSKSEYDRLVGQVESLQPNQNAIIVVLCGQTSQTLLARLVAKYKVSGGSSESRKFEIVVKSHRKRHRSIKRAVSKPTRATKQKFDDLIDLHARRIRETRITNNLYAELRKLRDTFLQHGLADKSKINREFFNKWLTDPVVEMGWTPAGGWTRQRVADLHTDLEKLTGTQSVQRN